MAWQTNKHIVCDGTSSALFNCRFILVTSRGPIGSSRCKLYLMNDAGVVAGMEHI